MKKTNYSSNLIITNSCQVGKMLRIMILGILLLCLSIFFLSEESYAKANEISNKEYVQVCEEALKIIAPINKEKLEVEIGNIYNVVDIEGNLDGYSLGYYVNNNPYGYAIYSIDSSNIREFVFYPGVENLYTELKNKAEELEEVKEKELVGCVVYEGGLEYSTYDENGIRVGYLDDEYSDSEISQEVEYEVEDILNSRYACKTESTTGNKNFYDTDLNVFDVLQDGGEYYCIPDFGLAMITQNYIYANSPQRGYTCDVVSATGCLNYFGYLYNNSIIDTYNMLFDKCITDKNLWGTNPGTNSHDAIKEYLKSQNSQISVTYEFDPSFDRFKYAFTSVKKEGTPVIIRDNSHSVLGLSCYEVNNTCYVGIWKNWFLDENDPNIWNDDFSGVHTDNSLMGLRYFNYNDRGDWNDKQLECTFFDNVKSKNTKELNVQYVSGNQVVITCYLPYGTTSVAFPTWTENNGQDDIIWHPGVIKYGTVAECTIDLNTHNKESGRYITNVYACDKDGICAEVPEIDYYINTMITNVTVKKNGVKGYTLTCNLPTGTERVQFPTWSSKGGQDDLIWYEGTINNGKGKITIDIANHNNDGGEYITNIYAYDKYGNSICCVGKNVSLLNRNTLTSVKLDNSINGRITCSYYAPVGTDYVTYEIMATKIGRLGHRMFKQYVISTNGYVTRNIYKFDFQDTTGKYLIRICAYNSKKQMLDTSVMLEADMK